MRKPATHYAETREIIATRQVVEDETGDVRDVLRDCRVCYHAAERYGCGVLSPSGVAHIGLDGGDTLCGKDATRDGWWWPL